MKNIRYIAEAVLVYFFYFIFWILGPNIASAAGGWFGRFLGPKLAASRKADRNIALAFPDLSAHDRYKIVRGMWDNLGRVIAEYPHLEIISKNYTRVIGHENLNSLLNEQGGPAVFIGAHLANWEINGSCLYTKFGKRVDLTYRAPNNPWTAKLLERARTLRGRLQAYPKSAQSGRSILNALKQGHLLGILIDQKYNEGLSVPFLGHPAMTNPIFVQLSQRFDCPLIPVRIRRLEGCHFEITVYPSLCLFDKNKNPLPLETVIQSAHTLLEEWVKACPDQWLWLHRRWSNVSSELSE